MENLSTNRELLAKKYNLTVSWDSLTFHIGPHPNCTTEEAQSPMLDLCKFQPVGDHAYSLKEFIKP